VFSTPDSDALDATAVAGGLGAVDDAFDLASNKSAAWPTTTAVCFTSLLGGTLAVDDGSTALAVGTVYYISTISAADPAVTTISRTSGGAILSLDGTPAVTNTMAKAHATMGCAARSTGPAGTASVAWNDTATTSENDSVMSTALIQAVGNDSLAAAAASTETTTGGTAYRYNTPDAVAFSATTTSTPSAWSEAIAAGTELPDVNGEISGRPVVVDTVNNTIVAEITFDAAVTTEYFLYSYDANDYFYLGSAENVGGTATTEAGFEGTFVSGAASKGLLSHKADADGQNGAANAWARGDIDHITYQSVEGNVSVFKLGG